MEGVSEDAMVIASLKTLKESAQGRQYLYVVKIRISWIRIKIRKQPIVIKAAVRSLSKEDFDEKKINKTIAVKAPAARK